MIYFYTPFFNLMHRVKIETQVLHDRNTCKKMPVAIDTQPTQPFSDLKLEKIIRGVYTCEYREECRYVVVLPVQVRRLISILTIFSLCFTCVRVVHHSIFEKHSIFGIVDITNVFDYGNMYENYGNKYERGDLSENDTIKFKLYHRK